MARALMKIPREFEDEAGKVRVMAVAHGYAMGKN
jgi:hypothetical protein